MLSRLSKRTDVNKPEGVTLRTAVESDVDALVALEQNFAPEDRFDKATWRRLLRGHTVTVVAESAGEMAGAAMVLFRRTSKVARLYTISVGDRFRGRGLSHALLQEVETRARVKGCDTLSLEVRESHIRAMRVYEQAGFSVVARLEDYYPDKEAALRLRKPLPSEANRT